MLKHCHISSLYCQKSRPDACYEKGVPKKFREIDREKTVLEPQTCNFAKTIYSASSVVACLPCKQNPKNYRLIRSTFKKYMKNGNPGKTAVRHLQEFLNLFLFLKIISMI